MTSSHNSCTNLLWFSSAYILVVTLIDNVIGVGSQVFAIQYSDPKYLGAYTYHTVESDNCSANCCIICALDHHCH